jgi:fucose permease
MLMTSLELVFTFKGWGLPCELDFTEFSLDYENLKNFPTPLALCEFSFRAIRMTSKFGAFFDMESASVAVRGPAPIHYKDTIPTPNAIELDEISWGAHYNGSNTPGEGYQSPHSGAQTPRFDTEFTISRPPTPKQSGAANIALSWSNPPKNKWRVLSCCLVLFGNGMNDSAPGALLPSMEKHYNIGYAVVSLIFVSQAAGFILSAFFNDAILNRLGRAKSLMLAELLIVFGYIVVVCTPPFAVAVTAYLIVGFGYSVGLALINVFCANLADSTVVLGVANGFYGLGGVVGPIIATSMVSHGLSWSRYYLITLGLRSLVVGIVGLAFWNYEKETPTNLLDALERTASRRAALDAGEPTTRQLFAQSLKNRITIMGALFVFAYQGAEVSISGWVISFLINYRHGDPAQVGYVTAGFWGGITLGRFTLSHAASLIGEKRFVYGLGIGAIAFQTLVWLIPNIIGDAVAVAFLGLLLGPIAPCCMVMFLRLLPRRLQTTSISFVSSAGSSGGAVAPFLTGLLAQAVGTYVLHPVCIGLFVVMLSCWFLLPKVERREE